MLSASLRIPEETMSEQRTVITISRQLASGGVYIGRRVARKLGYKYVDREILEKAAEQLDADRASLAAVEERCSGFLDNLVKSFTFGTPEAAFVAPLGRPVYDREVFETESCVIKGLANRYNCVVVGHAAFFVLRGRGNVLNVLIHAPEDFRIKRLQDFHKISADQARAEIQMADNQRDKFIRTMTKLEWKDARNYHLSINSQAAGFENVENMIIGLVEKVKADAECNGL
jgi:cytidylate kinase